MVGARRGRTIAGISGLVAISFFSGIMLTRNIYQKKLFEQRAIAYVAETNLSLEKETNQKLMQREAYLYVDYFKKILKKYYLTYLDLGKFDTDVAADHLEDAIEQEIYDTWDFIDSLEDRKFPEKLVKGVRKNFRDFGGLIRRAIDLEKVKYFNENEGKEITYPYIFGK